MNSIWNDEQSVSPVIGVILMVAITVILAAVVGVFATGMGGELNEVSGNVGVEFQESPVGLEMTVETIDTTADVRINGETIATMDESDTGRTVLLPTAPGDRITVVSGNDQQSVLVDKTAEERDEVGDFISYYTYDDESNPDRITDFSNQENHLDLVDSGATYTDDGAVDFTHQSGGARNDSLSGPLGVTVNEITVVHAVQIDGPGRQGTGNGAQSESMRIGVDSDSGGHQIGFDHHEAGATDYATRFYSNEGNFYANGIEHEFGTTHVYAVTITADELQAYIDGRNVGQANHDDDVTPTNFGVATELFNQEEMDGKIYETRIYHHALNDEEMDSVSSLMQERTN